MNYAREAFDASLDDDWREDVEDARWEAEQDAREADTDALHYAPYRCYDRMCGALDCSNCHPGTRQDDEEEEAEPVTPPSLAELEEAL